MASPGTNASGQPSARKKRDDSIGLLAMIIMGVIAIAFIRPPAITERLKALAARATTPTPEPAQGQLVYIRNADGTFSAKHLPPSIGGYSRGPFANPTPSLIDQRRGWQSTSSLNDHVWR